MIDVAAYLRQNGDTWFLVRCGFNEFSEDDVTVYQEKKMKAHHRKYELDESYKELLRCGPSGFKVPVREIV